MPDMTREDVVYHYLEIRHANTPGVFLNTRRIADALDMDFNICLDTLKRLAIDGKALRHDDTWRLYKEA